MVARHVQFMLFLASGFLVFGFPLFLDGIAKPIVQAGIVALFAFVSLYLRRNTNSDKRYFFIFFAFFVAALVYLLDSLLYANWSTLNLAYSRMDQYIIAKIISTILIVIPIVVLAKISGQSMSSIYLSKGKWKLSLLVGAILFFLFLATSVPAATLLYRGKNLTYSSLLTWAPWIFTFVLANALREEVLFRGLFLKKYQAFFTIGLSNLLQAFIFVMPHVGETYTSALIAFLFIVFFLGLAFGALMQKTNTAIGSILFHAGTDILVVLGIFSNF